MLSLDKAGLSTIRQTSSGYETLKFKEIWDFCIPVVLRAAPSGLQRTSCLSMKAAYQQLLSRRAVAFDGLDSSNMFICETYQRLRVDSKR